MGNFLFNTSKFKEINFLDGDKFESLDDSPGQITYLKTDTVIYKISQGDVLCPSENILISHNSDYSINSSILPLVKLPRYWFAQNALIKHERITPIPIGLERIRWFPLMRKREILLEFLNRSDTCPIKLCLANFSLTTNYAVRKKCLDKCAPFSTVSVLDLVGQEPYRFFLDSVMNHFFVLCPEGNGVDTHRFWETLYLGRIPIVTSNPLTESFKDLPILIVPSWDSISSQTLITYLDEFNAGRIEFSLDKLDFLYWKNIIKQRAKK